MLNGQLGTFSENSGNAGKVIFGGNDIVGTANIGNETDGIPEISGTGNIISPGKPGSCCNWGIANIGNASDGNCIAGTSNDADSTIGGVENTGTFTLIANPGNENTGIGNDKDIQLMQIPIS